MHLRRSYRAQKLCSCSGTVVGGGWQPCLLPGPCGPAGNADGPVSNYFCGIHALANELFPSV